MLSDILISSAIIGGAEGGRVPSTSIGGGLGMEHDADLEMVKFIYLFIN